MRALSVGREFDVVTCMFFAVTYMPTPDDLATAIGAMARHLAPGGVLVVEPWWFRDRFIDGYVGGHLVEGEYLPEWCDGTGLFVAQRPR